MENSKLKEDEELIELNLIKLLGWVDTGGEAKIRIDNQEVELNGVIETQRRKKILIMTPSAKCSLRLKALH